MDCINLDIVQHWCGFEWELTHSNWKLSIVPMIFYQCTAEPIPCEIDIYT